MCNRLLGASRTYGQGRQEGARGQIAPGPQAPRGLITPTPARSRVPHIVDQQYFSTVKF